MSIATEDPIMTPGDQAVFERELAGFGPPRRRPGKRICRSSCLPGSLRSPTSRNWLSPCTWSRGGAWRTQATSTGFATIAGRGCPLPPILHHPITPLRHYSNTGNPILFILFILLSCLIFRVLNQFGLFEQTFHFGIIRISQRRQVRRMED